eukprot:251149-Prymnesium_polylepis.1
MGGGAPESLRWTGLGRGSAQAASSGGIPDGGTLRGSGCSESGRGSHSIAVRQQRAKVEAMYGTARRKNMTRC